MHREHYGGHEIRHFDFFFFLIQWSDKKQAMKYNMYFIDLNKQWLVFTGGGCTVMEPA